MIGRLSGALLASALRLLGPYRTWRMLHLARVRNPQLFGASAEFFFKNELPDRVLSREFLRYWLDDGSVADCLRAHTAQLGSPFYHFRVFQEVRQKCLEHGLIPRRVLEIGPGMHTGVLFCFAGAGCEKVAGVDIEPIRSPDGAFYDTLMQYLAVVSGFGWWRHTAAANPYPEITHPDFWDMRSWRGILARIDYRAPVASHDMPFDDASFDLVYSITAFEHFPEPEKTVREIRRVLAPGGLTIHEVDMRHHKDMRYHEPAEALEFLGWDNEKHARITEKYGDGKGLRNLVSGEWGKEVYCNRLRLSDCQALFDQCGFEVLDMERLELLAEREIDRERFVEPFRSKALEDLSVLVARLTARKSAES